MVSKVLSSNFQLSKWRALSVQELFCHISTDTMFSPISPGKQVGKWKLLVSQRLRDLSLVIDKARFLILLGTRQGRESRNTWCRSLSCDSLGLFLSGCFLLNTYTCLNLLTSPISLSLRDLRETLDKQEHWSGKYTEFGFVSCSHHTRHVNY